MLSNDSKTPGSYGRGSGSSLEEGGGDLLHTLFPEQMRKAKALCAPPGHMYATDEFLLTSAADRFCHSLLAEEEEEEEEEPVVGEQWLSRKPVKKSEDQQQKEPVILFSAIDGYSRFLFPSCFMLYNCFYWLYYLVLKKKD
ncbi:unnamed protein product [Dibothriocephalus latus]|uniref:Neurotransmitter-gated ion-channel transmembrane domain-containing protein n=1 Tax=Dibothriocephalus latus TaxID=60516 RepID=A0A3P7P3D8_DIBLA|nr:unnamed protein product [Dibothriocephalus latus]